MMDEALHRLATAVGIEVAWRDVSGATQTVSDDSLRAVLGALALPAATAEQIEEAEAALRHEAEVMARPLVTAPLHRPVALPGRAGRFRVTLESGEMIDGMAMQAERGVLLPAFHQPGYHRVELNGVDTTVAVAPARAYTLEDAGQGGRMWGLAVQLYALRRRGGGGIGDFAALADFGARAATLGADAVAISPVHAQFSADVSRFGPYAPSNRAMLNVLHIAGGTDAAEDAALVDWPTASAAKLAALRGEFGQFHDHAALEEFRRAGGVGLERHAIFEALAATLAVNNLAALDWRNWPLAYRDPGNAAVARFLKDDAREVSFQVWLQYRANQGLRAAQEACRAGGMRIGLLADLAVGTDHAGSHSWSRQDEVLRGLEIGAPPDLINREGQSWGITAFSPRGLVKSGFSAFIDMLRHALRHAGGVRIDHVMGLARLWVIPEGLSSAAGAYLRLPVDDLMRLVALESSRHQAVILGEDLGTLPQGFDEKLNGAGIAGLRVMWFERDGKSFTPPARWTRTAVAMTTTHDLPTVAGWWQSEDIAWREKLDMAGDGEAERADDRAALWSAFRESGATDAVQPAAADGAAASYAACAHLGRAGSLLALLPIEDALSSADQPNLPGTTDEHPNWRRRLPADAEALFSREDVAARLAVLHAARRRA